MIILQTERLTIRTWQSDDWRLLRPMHNDPDVMRTLGGELLNDSQLQELATRQQENFGTHNYCYWPVELAVTGECIGLCGIQPKDNDPYDFGWRIAKLHWNQGYATEAAVSIRDYALNSLKIPLLTATALTHNAPSIKVMKKVGMIYVNEFPTPYGPHARYQLDHPNPE